MLLDGLNERQREAITTGEGPVLVLAGPGSGKTRVLTHRIAFLIQDMGVDPRHIMAVTFTNKAAGEMRHRVENLLGGHLKGLQIGTFHAICARLLRIESDNTPYGGEYVIYDTDDQRTAVTQAMGELNLDLKKYNPRRVLGQISNAKNELIEPADYPAYDHFSEVVRRVYERYQTILIDNNAMDFDDLLMQMVFLLRDNDAVREKYQQRYDFVLIDEFQDTNTAQYKLVQMLGKPRDNVFVVGDEDQGIYAFRGADYRNVLQFRKDYPQAKVILLEQNYRSTQHILDAARAVIDRNPNRTRKELFTDRGTGERLILTEAYNEDFEARQIMEAVETLRRDEGYDWRDFAVMYRTNAQSRAIEDACIKQGVPYKLIGGVGFYKRREIKDLLAYLRIVNNLSDRVSFSRIINTPKRGIGTKSLTDFQYWAANACDNDYDMALQLLLEGEETPLSGRVSRLFADFATQLYTWREIAQRGELVELFDRIVADIGYNLYIAEISESDIQMTERHENIDQLRSLLVVAHEEGQSLSEFLAENALVADVDALDESEDTVTLLTLHAAKGLEYPIVFIIGVEEGLIPHSRAFEEAEGVEEERRLLYVGITRAKDRLYLSYAFRRMMYGGSSANSPSRFLADIPVTSINGVTPRLSGQAGEIMYKRATTWNNSGSSWRSKSDDSSLYADDDDDETDSESRKSNSKIRSKIMRFPGSKPPKYPTGQRVHHPMYGAGIVIETRGSGASEEVSVAFEDKQHGIKKFLTEFANLTPVEG